MCPGAAARAGTCEDAVPHEQWKACLQLPGTEETRRGEPHCTSPAETKDQQVHFLLSVLSTVIPVVPVN